MSAADLGDDEIQALLESALKELEEAADLVK
jgi:hypothetical protein